jgi:hypothetical protein
MAVPAQNNAVEYTTNTLARAGTPLDHLLHSKSRILRTKLEVLAAEIQSRLGIRSQNLARIDSTVETVTEQLDRSARLARYHLRDQRDVTRLREAVLQLASQEREEDVHCWRDVFQALRDFLAAWEAHEQAKSRAIFINAGPGTQNPL